MSKAKLTFQSALWNHAGKTLEYVLMYVTSIIIARGLGVQENGRLVGLFSLSQLLLVFCSFGLETSLNKFIPQLAQEKNNERATYVLRRALLIRVVAFVAVAALFYLMILFISIPFLESSGNVLLFVLAFTGIRSLVPLFAMVLTAQLNTALTARINLVIRIIEISAIVVLTQFQFTVQNVFILFLSTSALHVAAYAVFSRMNFLGGTEAVDMKPILTFGSIYWVNTIVDFVLGRQCDILFLTNLLPDSSQGGLYDVAYSIAQLASMAMTVGLTGVTFATFARLAVSDQAMMNRFYSFSIRIISLLTIPFYAFMIFNAEAVLTILYSSHYLAASTLVQSILVFRIISRLFGGPENGEYLLSHGRVGTVVTFGIIAASINVFLNILLIPRLGAAGSVIASGCANLLVNILAAFAVYRSSPNEIQVGFWLKVTVACLTAAFLSAYLIPFESMMSLILIWAVYIFFAGIGFMLIRPLTSDDVRWLSRANNRFEKLLERFTSPSSNLAESKPS